MSYNDGCHPIFSLVVLLLYYTHWQLVSLSNLLESNKFPTSSHFLYSCYEKEFIFSWNSMFHLGFESVYTNPFQRNHGLSTQNRDCPSNHLLKLNFLLILVFFLLITLIFISLNKLTKRTKYKRGIHDNHKQFFWSILCI